MKYDSDDSNSFVEAGMEDFGEPGMEDLDEPTEYDNFLQWKRDVLERVGLIDPVEI